MIFRFDVLRALLLWSVVSTSVGCASVQARPDTTRKQISAVRIDTRDISIDGRLDDPAWKAAHFSDDFLQKEPNQGSPPSNRTRVAIAYDSHALYVGAHLSTDHPDRLRMHLDRHDNQGPAEQFIVSIDTYLDRRTAYGFGVNVSGVRFDRYNPEDDEESRDYSYNPVWTARTAVTDSGWSVEMRIPFSQLRFTEKQQQVWGINFNRWIPERNEDVFWVYVPRDETGWSSYFGNLTGIEGIKPSSRIELLPYAASNGSLVHDVDASDPFHEGTELNGRLGTDLKMGLGSNLTFDATINPDFGQVEADAAEVNLSQYETSFPEKRPFFIEGRQLFDPAGPTYFYSRRIGAPPHGSSPGDFVDRPSNTSILGAGKLTGRLQSGLSIGALSAVTGREHARTRDIGVDSTVEVEVEPPTIFNVLRLQQELNQGASVVGLILTGVARDFSGDSSLRDELAAQAYSGGGDYYLRLFDGSWELEGHAGFSHVRGDEKAIAAIQRSSTHYFQRPDADYVDFDSTRTSLSGYSVSAEMDKISGSHWLGGAGFNAESPGFELNDAGILNSADDIDAWQWIEYRETQPNDLFRSYSVSFSINSGWNYGGIRQYQSLEGYIEARFANFSRTSFGMTRQMRGQSDSRTRGGPVMSVESWYSWYGSFSTDYSAPTRWGVNGTYSVDELDGWYYQVGGSLNTRVGNRIKLSLDPYYRREDQPRQYVTTIGETAGGEATYGSRYIFSRIARTTTAVQVRADYFFTPDLSLQVYAEPFVASGRYYDFGELARPGTHDLRFYGTDGTSIVQTGDGGSYTITDSTYANEEFTIRNPDFFALSFRSNVVLRWEFTPGSTLYLVWQRNLSGERDSGRRARPQDLLDTLKSTGEDFFALKVSYWIPVS